MIIEKNVKDIRNITVQGGSLRMRFDRVSPTEFRISHYSIDLNDNICPKCSGFIHPGEEEDHRHEKYEIQSEEYMIDQIESLFREDTNVVCINEGLPTEEYLVINEKSEYFGS